MTLLMVFIKYLIKIVPFFRWPVILIVFALFNKSGFAQAKASSTVMPNVLFIAIDDLNDWTGFMGGHPQAQTPQLDKLANQASVFTNAYCSSPACGPSRTSLLFNKGWAEDAIQVAEFDTINKTIKTAQAHHYGFGTGAKWKQWYAFNILEEIDEPGNNKVINCKIHDFNRIEKSYRSGIWIRGVGNTIANCEIFNAPMMAIWLHGNEHVIEYSDFHDVVRDMHDQGAIYYGRNPSERGNVVRYNYFHDLGNDHISVSIYHDDGACNMTVHGNIFHKAGSMPVLIGGGNDNTYTNNIFIDCPIGIHVDNRKQGWAKGSGDKGGAWQFEKRLNAVEYQNPPYSTKYHELVKYWEEDKTPHPKNNIIQNNIFYEIDKLIDGDKKWMSWGENKILNSTPEFWDESNKQFNLKNGKIIFEGWAAFESIFFSKIGCKLK